MAIKITGTTVISDSRALENITDINNIIKKPAVTSPTNGETDVVFADTTIVGSPYSAVFQNRDFRQFQVDLSTGDFSSPIVDVQQNADSLTLTVELAGDTQHKVRIRDVDVDGVASDFSDVVSFTTEQNPFAQPLGTAVCGGFYMGAITAVGQCYALVISPASSGFANNQSWKDVDTLTSGVDDLFDGYASTYPHLANSTHNAGNFTATRTINGFSDWYLPASEEWSVMYNSGGGGGAGDPLPAGEDFGTQEYWTSNEVRTCYARTFRAGNGSCGSGVKRFADKDVRAIRREPI